MKLGNLPTSTSVGSGNWLDTLLKAGTVYLTLEQQKELSKIQMQRLAQGLPPLDASAYTPGMSVGLASGTQNTLILIVGVLAVAWLLSSLVSRR